MVAVLQRVFDEADQAAGTDLDEGTKAIGIHVLDQLTEAHRLEQVFELMEVPARGKKCDAIEGIITEAKKHMEEIEDQKILDAGMIGSAQAVEHYEITRYGTLIAWAKQIGLDGAVDLLKANLAEEKHADDLLSEIAEASVNQKAAA